MIHQLEVERILTECKEKPQILLMENVPQVHGEGNKEDFNKWQLRLEELGYSNYWQDLIATDYGIPQTRNRTFMVSLLGDYNYTFPKPIPLELKLKDMLEDNVDEKYFLSDKMIKHITSRMPSGEHHITTGISIGNEDSLKTASTITTRAGNRATDNYLIENKEYDYSKKEGKIIKSAYLRNFGSKGKLQNKEYCNTLTSAMGEGGGNVPLLKIKNNTQKGYLEAKEGVVTIGNYSPSNHNASRIVDKNYSAPTVMENHGTITATQTSNLRIRKLTPRECFRLMGVKDEDYDKIAKNQSDSSLYHLAGDSIVVNVLMAIFKELL